ncbi:hypothetical protein KCQ71_03655 [Ruania sp. N2-46]|uniref:Uncharacterized protein n=1 Tax=Occultella gossypii TaxID=2800820 RepID=A0ABS7S4H2_9MICO|nr:MULTISPECIES: hypothetical protein [Occultella]MBZ2195240.1 hypothetical protein [Occultella gossypii]
MVAILVEDASQDGSDHVRICIEALEPGHDARHQPTPPVVVVGNARPHPSAEATRVRTAEGVEVERCEGLDRLARSTCLERRCRPDRDDPGVPVGEAIEVGLHYDALLVLEKEEIAFPDKIPCSFSGRWRRVRVLQYPAALVECFESGQHGCIATLVSQEGAEQFDPVF